MDMQHLAKHAAEVHQHRQEQVRPVTGNPQDNERTRFERSREEFEGLHNWRM